ncbi:MAG: chloride channel protein, partial [Deltaproteobacteria bacterium]|nr:chloride channel protein [Deltaproteobacteria bacterium]
SQLGNSWYLVPPALGAAAAILHSFARSFQRRGVSDRSIHTARLDRRQALADVFESYHFGIFILHPLNWLARGLVSLLNAFLGGTFGVEGGVLELSFLALPLLSRYIRLFIEEKQTFVVCTIAASLSVAVGAPFSGGLIALELVLAVDARVRAGAVLAALTAYGTALLFQSTLLRGLFAETAVERLNILGALFAGLKPLNLEIFQWALLSLAALCVGIGSGMLAAITSGALSRGSLFFADFFKGRFRLAMLTTGVLMGITVYLVPESFIEPWRAWEDLAWLRLSSARAITLLVTEWVLLVLAFSGWGSSGLFSPVLLLGALGGYAVGNMVGTTWALPLAIAGAVSMLSAMFRIPIAAAALVLEVGHDGPMWWLSTLAVLSATLFTRSLGIKPFHEMLLERTGLRLLSGRAVSVLANLKTSEAMFDNIETISETAGIQEMRAAAAASRHNFLGVVSSSDGTYLGLLSLEQLPGRVRHVLRPDVRPSDVAAIERVVEIRDLIDNFTPTIRPDESLERALALLEDAPCVAVVDENRKLRGFLFESAVSGVYKREIAGTVIRQS